MKLFKAYNFVFVFILSLYKQFIYTWIFENQVSKNIDSFYYLAI